MRKMMIYGFRGLFATALVVSLAGCGRSPPKATDVQLEVLLGNNVPSFYDGVIIFSNQISKQVDQCLGLISGLDQDIYKDAPKELTGTMSTECRKSLKARTSNNAINPLGFVLADFEDQTLALRVRELRKRLIQESNRKLDKLATAKYKADQIANEKVRQKSAAKIKAMEEADTEAKYAAQKAMAEEAKNEQQAALINKNMLKSKTLGIWKGEVRNFGSIILLELNIKTLTSDGLIKGTLLGVSAPNSRVRYADQQFEVSGRIVGELPLIADGVKDISIRPTNYPSGNAYFLYSALGDAHIDFSKMMIYKRQGSTPFTLTRVTK